MANPKYELIEMSCPEKSVHKFKDLEDVHGFLAQNVCALCLEEAQESKYYSYDLVGALLSTYCGCNYLLEKEE